MSWLPLRIPLHCKVKARKVIFSVGFWEMRSNPRLWSLAHTRRGSQRWCRFRKIHILGFKNIFQDLNFLRQMVEDDNQFLEVENWSKYKISKTKTNSIQIDQTKTRWLHLEQNSLGGWWSSGWRAPAERWTTIRFFKKNFFKKSIWNFLSGEWLPMQWTAALFQSSPNSSSRKSAGKRGNLKLDWNICYRWKSYTAPEKTVLMTNVQVREPWISWWWPPCRTVSSNSSKGLRTSTAGCW